MNNRLENSKLIIVFLFTFYSANSKNRGKNALSSISPCNGEDRKRQIKTRQISEKNKRT